MGVLGTVAKGGLNFFVSCSGIGTLVNAGVGILGNLLGNKSQQDANKANMQISQMNNQFNERMLEKQMHYNSAQQQVERFKDAGLNPALMMQGQGAGQVSNTTASATPAMQAYRPDFSSIGSSIEAAIQRNRENEMLDEQIKGVRIENQFKRQRIIKELANLDEQNLSAQAKRRIDNITANHLNGMYNAQIEDYKASANQKNRNADFLVAQKLLTDKQINNFDARWNVEKAQAVAQTLMLGASRDLTYEQMRKEVYNTIQQEYKARHEELDFKTAERMADAIVDKAYSDADKSYYDAYHEVSTPWGLAGRARQWYDSNVQGNHYKRH